MRFNCCPPLPYGPLIALPLSAGVISTVFTWIATFACDFFLVGPVALNDKTISFGLWKLQDFRYNSNKFGGRTATSLDPLGGECVGWNHHTELTDDAIDAPMKFGRAVSIMAAIISFFVLLFLIMPVFRIVSRGTLRSLSGFMILLALLTLLSLVTLKSDFCQSVPVCELGNAAVFMIFASIFWCVGAVSVLFLRPRGESHRSSGNSSGNSSNNNKRDEAPEQARADADGVDEEAKSDLD